MDLSMRWLADYVDCGCDTKTFCDGMTLSGSKVECFEQEGDYLKNVVVGKILSVKDHPDSDHMVICQVDVGDGEPIQIVTGASNVSEGDFVPVAKHKSSVLHEGKVVKITKGKLRGEVSDGMLCSIGELGFTTHDFPYAIDDGIFILGDDCDRTVGKDIREAVGFDDTKVEFEITSNRPDCLSVLGLAREASATFNVPVNIKEPSFEGVDGDINEIMSVKIHNPELCPRYMCGYVKNVKIEPSPRWLRERLRACGVRPINNFVDITNFVMLEYGQPMHAFDLRYVEGAQINIRNAVKGERITTLDGIERELSEEMLVIADSKKPVAVAGVMGGEYSGIMDDTTAVVFEAASFNGASVRTTAKKLGMRTDASARFEKELNPENAYPALIRAFELVELLGCGEVIRSFIDCDMSQKKDTGVEFNPEWINNFLGTDIDAKQMAGYLESLSFEIKDGKVYAPYYRIDIECKADVAEEVARLYGYNNIPKTIIKGQANAQLTDKQKFDRLITSSMLGMGVNEITTFSFISPKYFDKIRLPKDSKLRRAVKIMNPLGEDTSVMRTTILPSICEVMARNYSYRNDSCYVFELGNEYIPQDGEELPTEPERLGIGFYDTKNKVDFYTVKGMIEQLLDRCGAEQVEFSRPSEDSAFGETDAFHPGRCASAFVNGREIALFGELHPETLENYGINCRTYAAKVNVPELMELCVTQKTYKPLPKYPAIMRDLSLICDEELAAAVIEKTIRKASGKILESITLFDIYRGEQIAQGKKSISYSLTFRSHEATLTDEQADKTMAKILSALGEQGAELRM